MERIWVIGWKFDNKWGNNAHDFILPTNCTNWHERYALSKMATGSVARIVTNAMKGIYDNNRDNLGQLEVVFCGRNGNDSNYYCPRIIGKYFFCPRIARMDTNGCNGLKWRPGRSHEFALMQGGGYMTTTGTT